MGQHYVAKSLLWLTVIWVMGTPLCVQAQSTHTPLTQWQRTMDDRDLPTASSVQAVKATNGGYGVLAGKSLTLLSATGELSWKKSVPGSYADSSTNRFPINEAVSIAPTPDGGFAVLGLDVANRYYVAKLDSAGAGSWAKTIDRAAVSSAFQVTQNALVTAPDGSILVIGSYTDSLSYVALTKLTTEGVIAGQWRIKFTGPTPSTPLVHQVLPLSDQGYLLVGRAAGRASAPGQDQGVAIQLDAQYNLIWQHVYPELSTIQQAVANPKAAGTYIAIGSGADNKSQAIILAPNKPGDGSGLALFPDVVAAVSLVNDGADNLTLLDIAGGNNGDFRLTNGALPAAVRWTKTFGGSGTDRPTALLTTDDGGYLAVGTTTSTDGDVAGKLNNTVAVWVVKLGQSPLVTTLRLEIPLYDCQTGVIRFQTSGGDGSPITYVAPGITRAQLTDNFGTIEPELRNDPKVITIQAMQAGQTVRYTFDLTAICRGEGGTGNADSLQLIAPTYNCQTGAITFHTTGGDGTAVEYDAPGITGWTTNPNQFVDPALRTAYDAQPIALRARQRGRVVRYLFNLKAACGRARLSATEVSGLTVALLGNPAQETATVEIKGAQEQSLLLRLVDEQGRLIEQRFIEQAGIAEQQTFDLRQQSPGILLLHTAVHGRAQTIKVIKQ